MTMLLLLALAAANLPFIAERLLLLVPLKTGKNLAWHLLELLVLYFMVGGVSMLLEQQIAPRHSQNWEFYAVTVCLFLVFAFPGFTYRYLWRKR
ncbi:MAG: DUF2818 domain-containing protein [Nitrosomonadales bacterium]|nr:MAG: DUF2818 domain-containing protein [Nitrosomonadales bacterium]